MFHTCSVTSVCWLLFEAAIEGKKGHIKTVLSPVKRFLTPAFIKVQLTRRSTLITSQRLDGPVMTVRQWVQLFQEKSLYYHRRGQRLSDGPHNLYPGGHSGILHAKIPFKGKRDYKCEEMQEMGEEWGASGKEEGEKERERGRGVLANHLDSASDKKHLVSVYLIT